MPADLEEVVHHADELETRIVRGAGDGRQVFTETGRAARPGEVRDLQSDLHANTSTAEPLTQPMCG